MNWRVYFWNRKPSVQGTMRPLIFAYTGIGSSPDPVPRNVQSLTAYVRRFRLCQSASHSLVNWHVGFRNGRSSVQGTARPPRFLYTATDSYTRTGLGAVRTAGIRKCCLHHSASPGLVTWRVHFCTRRPSVQGTVRSPRFVYKASGYLLDIVPRNVQSCTAGVHRCH